MTAEQPQTRSIRITGSDGIAAEVRVVKTRDWYQDHRRALDLADRLGTATPPVSAGLARYAQSSAPAIPANKSGR